jgi:hypothetical protein
MPPESPRRSLIPPIVVGLAVLTAAVLLVLRMRLEPPTVPGYTLEGADGGDVVVREGQRFRLDLEPSGQVTGAVGAHAFLVRGETVRTWDPNFDVDRDGSVHVAGMVDKLFEGVPAGPWEMAIAVGRPETLPTAPRDILLAPDSGVSQAAWHLVRERIVLVRGAP